MNWKNWNVFMKYIIFKTYSYSNKITHGMVSHIQKDFNKNCHWWGKLKNF